MNSVTMMFFVVCLSGILLMAASNGTEVTVHKFCRMKDLVTAHVRLCRRSVGEEEEPVALSANDVGVSSRSKRSARSAARTAADQSLQESLRKMRESFEGWRDEEFRWTMNKQISDVFRVADEEGAGKVGDRRRRSIRRKGGVQLYGLLRRCCLQGCNDKDIERSHICHPLS